MVYVRGRENAEEGPELGRRGGGEGSLLSGKLENFSLAQWL